MSYERWICVHCDAVNTTSTDICSKCHRSSYEEPAIAETPIANSYQGIQLLGSWLFIPLIPSLMVIAIRDGAWWFAPLGIAIIALTILSEKSKFLISNAAWFKNLAIFYTPIAGVLFPLSVFLGKNWAVTFMVVHAIVHLHAALNMHAHCQNHKPRNENY